MKSSPVGGSSARTTAGGAYPHADEYRLRALTTRAPVGSRTSTTTPGSLPGQHLRSRYPRGAMAGHDAVVHFRGRRAVDRSSPGPTTSSTPTARHQRRDGHRPRLESPGLPHRHRELRLVAGFVPQTDPLEPRSPYSASKAAPTSSPCRTSRPTTAGHRHRAHNSAVPVPGRRYPLHHHLIDCGSIPLSATVLNERTGASTTTAPVSRWCSRRALRARSTTWVRATRPPTGCWSTSCSLRSGWGRSGSTTWPTAWGTTAATRSTSTR